MKIPNLMELLKKRGINVTSLYVFQYIISLYILKSADIDLISHLTFSWQAKDGQINGGIGSRIECHLRV